MKLLSFSGGFTASEAITVPEGGSVAVMADTTSTIAGGIKVKKATGRGVVAIALVHSSVASGGVVKDYTLLGKDIATVYSAEAIAINERVCFDSDGYALDWDTAGDISHGVALTAVTAASKPLLMLVTHDLSIKT